MARGAKLDLVLVPAVPVARNARKRPAKAALKSRLTPELKGFIDRVVVPILVSTYVEKLQDEKELAESEQKRPSCDPMLKSRKVAG
jgi:hypothetical protein